MILDLSRPIGSWSPSFTSELTHSRASPREGTRLRDPGEIIRDVTSIKERVAFSLGTVLLQSMCITSLQMLQT